MSQQERPDGTILNLNPTSSCVLHADGTITYTPDIVERWNAEVLAFRHEEADAREREEVERAVRRAEAEHFSMED